MTRVQHLACWTLVAVFGCTLIVAAVQAQNTENAEPKHAIKDVMKQAHTPGEAGGKSLLQRVTAGDASNEDKIQLLDLYISLVENDPPRGEKEAFQMKAGAAAPGCGESRRGPRWCARSFEGCRQLCCLPPRPQAADAVMPSGAGPFLSKS